MLSTVKQYLSRSLYPDCSSQISMISPFVEGEVFSCVLNKPLAPGYYMVECTVAGGGGTGEARFFWEGDNGGNEAAFFTFRLNKLGKRIIWLDKTRESTKIRLDCKSGKIRMIDFLRFVPLRTAFAEQRMHRRLSGDLGAEYDPAKLKGGGDLFTAYNRLFMPFQADLYDRWVERVEPYLQKSHSPEPGFSGVQAESYHLFCADNYQLAENARLLMGYALAQNPEAVLVYVDEDVIDHFGLRSNPQFKSDWNPDLFLSHDYVSACYLCRKEWVAENREVFERYGERLALTYLLPKLQPQQIVHLPLILAHYLLPEAIGHEELPAYLASQGSVDERQTVLSAGLAGEECTIAQGLSGGSLRVNYLIPEPAPLVSLLVPTRDGLAVLKPCIESILNKTNYPDFEILILDNQSQQQETLDWFASITGDERVRILRYDQPFNYSAINNFGAEQARGSIIGLINNDVEVISGGWLTEMVAHACRPEIGCVGAKLYYSNGQIQHAGVILGLGDVAGHSHRFLERDDEGYHGRLKLVQNYSAVTAACLLVRREIYDAVNGLEEEHLTVAYNDVDFCLRVRAAGYRNLWTPYAELYHHESISRGEDDTPEKKARYDKEVAYMKERWGKELDNDPCYNPNLSRRKEDFSLREFLP